MEINKLLCKFCFKLQRQLRKHLHQVCRKTASPEELDNYLDEAKKNRYKLLTSLSTVSFDALDFKKSKFSDPQSFLVDFLEHRGCIVSDKPSERPPSDAERICDEDVSEEAGPSSHTPQRRRLAIAGVYEKHNLDHPLLQSFGNFLSKEFGQASISAMMDHVAKFLFYLDPSDVSTNFLKSFEKSEEYFNTFLLSDTTGNTIKKYLGHIKQFIHFLSSEDCPNKLDEESKTAVGPFLEGLKKIEQKANQKDTKSRIRPLKLEPPTFISCQKVLQLAKPQVKTIFEQASSGIQLSESKQTLAVYYLEALLILKHLRKPSVPQNLKTKEWLGRQPYETSDGQRLCIIKTEEDLIILDDEDEQNFQVYFMHIRPNLQKMTKETVPQFLLSIQGQPIKNSSRDLDRLFSSYQLPQLSWKAAMDAFDKWALDELPKAKRENVRGYVQYRKRKSVKKDLAYLVSGMLILMTVNEDTERETETAGSPVVKRKRSTTEEKDSNEESSSEESGNKESGNKKSGRWEKYSYFQKLLEICPVHLNNTVPKLSICKDITKNNAKHCQKKWRRSQYQLRVADVAGHFRHRPEKDEVAAYIESQGWKSNLPGLDDVRQAWKKPESRKEADDSKYIMDMVKSQEWRGLVITEDHKRGGRKLMTTLWFKKGDIVCDYHGVLMDAKAAEKFQQTIQDGNCYMYFFHFKEKWMCIDATEEPCQCHQNLPSTFGRIINHSTKMNNLKPEARCLDGKDPVILFVALKDLTPGTELLFDYGVRRNQFGEGADLPWLDS